MAQASVACRLPGRAQCNVVCSAVCVARWPRSARSPAQPTQHHHNNAVLHSCLAVPYVVGRVCGGGQATASVGQAAPCKRPLLSNGGCWRSSIACAYQLGMTCMRIMGGGIVCVVWYVVVHCSRCGCCCLVCCLEGVATWPGGLRWLGCHFAFPGGGAGPLHATFVALCRVAPVPPHGRVRRATAALCSARSACVVVVVCRTLCAQLAVLGLPPVVAALCACLLHCHVCLGIAPWWLPPNRSAAAMTLAGGARCRDRRVCLPSLARRRWASRVQPPLSCWQGS